MPFDLIATAPADPHTHVSDEPCRFCCAPRAFIELVEVWSDHTFMLGACCGEMQEFVTDSMTDDPDYRLEVLNLLHAGGDEPLRRVAIEADEFGGEYGDWLLDYQLELRPIAQTRAKEFIRAHHRHNGPPAGWKFGAGIFNGRTLLGVIWVGRPANRVLQARGALEVNRLCINPGLSSALTWKACSAAYTWAARQARQLGATQLYTYTQQDETGMSLRYARWKRDALTKGGSWNTPSRPRTDKADTGKKVRWRAW